MLDKIKRFLSAQGKNRRRDELTSFPAPDLQKSPEFSIPAVSQNKRDPNLPLGLTRIAERSRHALKIIAPKCFEMMEGIPKETIWEIEKILLNEIGFICPSSDEEKFVEKTYLLIESYDWKWREWEYWLPIFRRLKRCPYQTERLCYFEPVTLNMEQERNWYTLEELVRTCTIKRAKEILPGVSGITRKAVLLEYLRNHKAEFNLLRDKLIVEWWNSVPHYEGPTPKRIYRLFLFTLLSRARTLCDVLDSQSLGLKVSYVVCHEMDKDFFLMSELPSNPWQYIYQPRMPCIDLILRSNASELHSEYRLQI